jgi:hypothetical protein
MCAREARMVTGVRGGSGVVDAGFVRMWSARYRVSELEERLLTEVSDGIAARAFLTRDDLMQVGRWKSSRSADHLERNSDQDIEELTRLALVSPDRLKERVLCLLRGVGPPVASAILTVAYPERFTVMDVRVLEVLHTFGELRSRTPHYYDYLLRCHALAARAGCGLRALDRALWQWAKEGA